VSPTVTDLYRDPVKGLSPERLATVQVEAGRGFPGDRELAFALPDTPFDPFAPVAHRKTRLLMLARDEALAWLKTRFDPVRGVLRVESDGVGFEASVRDPAGRARLEAFFQRFVPAASGGGLPRLVTADRHRFTDVGVHGPDLMEAISVVNLATVRDLSRRVGTELDPRRFRANILIDGLPAWEEFDLVGRHMRIGSVEFRGVRRTKRCAATEVNPTAAVRDVNVPRAILDNMGHADLGIYVHALCSGPISRGVEVHFPS
jgi:uncharacterized protein YcbX